ncbi:MAG: hypothetical protein K8H88_21220 [Sandaracinaceae bacterium]|nr:hypothetical protein [Sandaracinaceae bacterium]
MRHLAWLVLTCLPLAAAAQDARPACVEVEAIVRYGAGAYDHWVRVQNNCDRRARCRVATNVNPDPQTILLEPGATREVITFRGSPARELTPNVTCTLE